MAALCNGEQIDYTKIANDAKVPRSTVQEYFKILKETLLADEVPVWKRGLKRKTVETSKFYLFDSGVARWLARLGEVSPASHTYGHLLETVVHHELRCYLDQYMRDGEIAYWRTKGDVEVDFIVGNTAIEVKSTDNASTGDIKALRTIAEEGEFAHRVLVCREPQARIVNGIEILPYADFIHHLWAGSLIDIASVPRQT